MRPKLGNYPPLDPPTLWHHYPLLRGFRKSSSLPTPAAARKSASVFNQHSHDRRWLRKAWICLYGHYLKLDMLMLCSIILSFSLFIFYQVEWPVWVIFCHLGEVRTGCCENQKLQPLKFSLLTDSGSKTFLKPHVFLQKCLEIFAQLLHIHARVTYLLAGPHTKLLQIFLHHFKPDICEPLCGLLLLSRKKSPNATFSHYSSSANPRVNFLAHFASAEALICLRCFSPTTSPPFCQEPPLPKCFPGFCPAHCINCPPGRSRGQCWKLGTVFFREEITQMKIWSRQGQGLTVGVELCSSVQQGSLRLGWWVGGGRGGFEELLRGSSSAQSFHHLQPEDPHYPLKCFLGKESLLKKINPAQTGRSRCW